MVATKHNGLPPLQPEKVPANYGKSGFVGMTIAGIGPALAAVLTNPFDVAKVRMQLQGEGGSKSKVYTNSFQCVYKTFRAEGVVGIQRGLSASMLREGSKNFFRIGLFHPTLVALHPDHASPAPIWKRLIAGSISGAVGAMICNPIEIVKTRVQASSVLPDAVGYQGYKYAGLVDAFRVIVRTEGIRALWIGTSVSTVRSILATSVNMTANSALKEALLQKQGALARLGMQAGPLTDGVCSLVAAFLAVLANNPADVVRTRLYNQPFETLPATGGGPGRRVGKWYSGAFDCVGKILKHEGAPALMKGFFGHFFRTGPHYVMAFILIGYMERAVESVRRDVNEAEWRTRMVDFHCAACAEGGAGGAAGTCLPRRTLELAVWQAVDGGHDGQASPAAPVPAPPARVAAAVDSVFRAAGLPTGADCLPVDAWLSGAPALAAALPALNRTST